VRLGVRVARREHCAGIRVQCVQISRHKPGIVEDGAILVKRPVGPEGECCANHPGSPDESSHTGGGFNGVDGVNKIVFTEACAVERVGAGLKRQVCDGYGMIPSRDGHSRANLRPPCSGLCGRVC